MAANINNSNFELINSINNTMTNVLNTFKNDMINIINLNNNNNNKRLIQLEKEIKMIKFQNEVKNKPNHTEQNIINNKFISKSQNNIINNNKKTNLDLQSNFFNKDYIDSDNLYNSRLNSEKNYEEEDENPIISDNNDYNHTQIEQNEIDPNISNIKQILKYTKIKKQKFGIRGKYRKKIDKTDFEKTIQYIEFNEILNNKTLIQKFSLSKYHKNSNTAFYYCSDTNCKGKGFNTFNIEDTKLLYETIKYDNFKVTNEHSIPYEDHSYILNETILKDYEELNKKELYKKFKNYKYLKSFTRIYLDNHPEVGSSFHKILELFHNEYPNFKIDYDSISIDEKNELINNFKQRNKYKDNIKINIEDVINIKNFFIGAINNKKYKNSLSENFDSILTNLKINNINVVTKLKVNFVRKKKFIIKIFIQ